jgi:hypothetical protein
MPRNVFGTHSVLAIVRSSPSKLSRFETGPISSGDWHNASWLGTEDPATNQFRFEFDLHAAAKWARVYVASAGCAAVMVNGQTPSVDLRGICTFIFLLNEDLNKNVSRTNPDLN